MHAKYKVYSWFLKRVSLNAPPILSHVRNGAAWPYEMKYIKSYCYFGIYNWPAIHVRHLFYQWNKSIPLVLILPIVPWTSRMHPTQSEAHRVILVPVMRCISPIDTNGVSVIPLVPIVPIVPMDE